MQSKIIQKQSIVFQSNALINARYHLSMDEKKLILMAMKKILAIKKPTLEAIAQHQTFNIDLKELYALANEDIDYKFFARRMRKSVKDLWNRTIIIDDENSEDWIRWLSKTTWSHDPQYITLKLSTEIMPLLVGIEGEGYTAVQLETILALRSAVSIRLYELLEQYEDFRTRTISITELREVFALEHKWPRTNQFITRVIEPAITDINKNTNMLVDELTKDSFTKDGRTITYIQFNFKIKIGTSNKSRIEKKQNEKLFK